MKVLLLVQLVYLSSLIGSNLGRVVSKSRGQPFPRPQSHVSVDTQNRLDTREFLFVYARDSSACDLLSDAFNRYYKIIFGGSHRPQTRFSRSTDKNDNKKLLKRVIVSVEEPCEKKYPSLESDESCE